MLIARKHHQPPFFIKINGVDVEQVSSIRYLGLTITSDLYWSQHISQGSGMLQIAQHCEELGWAILSPEGGVVRSCVCAKVF